MSNQSTYLLPFEDTLHHFRETVNAGSFHEYDLNEIIRNIVDSLSHKPKDLDTIPIPFITDVAGVPEEDLREINAGIYHMTFSILSSLVVADLYDEQDELNVAYFVLDEDRGSLRVFSKNATIMEPNQT